MGSKSRLKRERRAAKQKMIMSSTANDPEFTHTCNQLKAVFARYKADDVIVALCVSDLWLPNISSQIKHTLVFAVSISMSADEFTGAETIESYAEFKRFIEQVYAVMPSFPMLEDYVPETDWGEVKISSNGSYFRIFYGGAVERIPDFITAFHFIHRTNTQAYRDMHLILLAQHQVLSEIDRADAGVADGIECGHIETPTEVFWKTCRKSVFSLSKLPELATASQGLIVKLGELPVPEKLLDFGGSVMTGSALPAIIVDVGGRYFPLALRNAHATILQYWADKKNNGSITKVIAKFISDRNQQVISGPLRVVTRTEQQPFIFSAVILGDAKPYLVIVLEDTELANLTKIENGLKRALSSGDWAFQPVCSSDAVQIRTKDGIVPSALNQLEVIAVVSRVTTVPGFLNTPKSTARILPLPDFVSIFDSIKDINELDKYWQFVDAHSPIVGGFIGPADRFAAFRDSNALLVDGAVTPTMISLDPHWGSNWRHQILVEYWNNAPPLFPDGMNTAWDVERGEDGLYSLKAKRTPAMSWCSVVSNCVVHFVLIVDVQSIEVDDGRILELLIHCLADFLNQRSSILSGLPLFKYRKIVTTCRAKMDSLVTSQDLDNSDQPLFTDWQVIENAKDRTIEVIVQANLQRIQRGLTDAIDASFEVAASKAWIEGLSSALCLSNDPSILEALSATSERKPRFMLNIWQRSVDVPDYANPLIPQPEHFKIARRDLAVAFKNVGAKEGRYELTVAKPLIDSARDNYRAAVHATISLLRCDVIVRFCIEQIDKLISNYDREKNRIQISLSHEVSYDRTKNLAKAHEQFIRESHNYRYLLECSFSMPGSGEGDVSEKDMLQLVAKVDWLLVLNNASDVIHNGIDVAGLELDHFFVPQVYYSDITGHIEKAFSSEAANYKLGHGLKSDDEVHAIEQSDHKWNALDQAFSQDTGLEFNKFIGGLQVLSRWPTAIGVEKLQFTYSASRDKVRDVLVESLEDMTHSEAENFIYLVSLNPKGIRRLLGKSTDECDVPLWEHNKRGDRYMLKPLIHVVQGDLTWGAASVERSARVWQQSFANGYMPADFDWPNVGKAVRDIKRHVEKQLEKATSAILLRATPYAKGATLCAGSPRKVLMMSATLMGWRIGQSIIYGLPLNANITNQLSASKMQDVCENEFMAPLRIEDNLLKLNVAGLFLNRGWRKYEIY